MNKKIMIGAAVLPAALVGPTGLLAKNGTKAPERPNIIYLMTDQQWAGAMSCAGNEDLHTPNMDLLAQKGVRFTNAYCAFPLSGPSRAAMFTGYMPSETGMIENEMPLKDSLRNCTLGTLVSNAGYDCVYAGKWHVNTVTIPDEEFGFDNIKDNGDIGLAESCVEYLKERDSKKPFFLVASFINPHNICEYARGQKTPHASVPQCSLEDCPNLPENFAVSPYDASVLRFEQQQDYKLYPTTSYTPDDWRRYRNAYYRLTEAVDAEIGKILAEVDRQGLWKNTVIIFTSDHGDGNGAHQWNQKTALYEEVAGVPMIVCLPDGSNAGTVSDALVNNGIDLLPTICEWTGAKVPHGRPGVSYKAVVENGEQGQEYIVTETNFNQTAGTLGWMVRTKDYKYVLYDKGQHREQLFDMRNDRDEMRNLAVESKYHDILIQHRAILENWLKTTPGPERQRHLRFIPE